MKAPPQAGVGGCGRRGTAGSSPPRRRAPRAARRVASAQWNRARRVGQVRAARSPAHRRRPRSDAASRTSPARRPGCRGRDTPSRRQDRRPRRAAAAGPPAAPPTRRSGPSAEKPPGTGSPSRRCRAARRRRPSPANATRRAVSQSSRPCAFDRLADRSARPRRSRSSAVDAVGLGALDDQQAAGRPPSPPPRSSRAPAASRAAANTSAAANSPSARRAQSYPCAAKKSWSGRNPVTICARSGGDRRQIRAGGRAEHRHPALGQRQRAAVQRMGQSCRCHAAGRRPYSFSIVHCSGCWCRRAKSITCATLVSAISKREHPHHRQPLLVHRQHQLERLRMGQAEEPLQHMHDELHRRVVVVQQQHLVQRRPLGLGLRSPARRRHRRRGPAAPCRPWK